MFYVYTFFLKQLNNIQSLISDPFNQIKGRIFGFLQQSEISIES